MPSRIDFTPANLPSLTRLQQYQAFMFSAIDHAAKEMHPATLDALRDTVKMHLDRVADAALGD